VRIDHQVVASKRCARRWTRGCTGVTLLCLQGGTFFQSGEILVSRGSLVRVGSEAAQYVVGHAWLVVNTDRTVKVQLYDPNTGGR
jgi:hypothetical protein